MKQVKTYNYIEITKKEFQQYQATPITNAQASNCSMDDIPGIDRLLSKLEYNAFSTKGRIASDYGVSKNLLDYYENVENNTTRANELKNSFDEYEKYLYDKVEGIMP